MNKKRRDMIRAEIRDQKKQRAKLKQQEKETQD